MSTAHISSDVTVGGDIPPSPDGFTNDRWQESRRRRRMLEGTWQKDLQQRLLRQLGTLRASAWGEPDITKNLLKSVVSQMAITYDAPPLIKNSDETQRKLMTGLLDQSGLWALAGRMQQLTLTQREAAYKIDIIEEDGKFRMQFRSIPADRLLAFADEDTPATPHTIYWYRRRQDLPSKAPDTVIWTRDCYSIQNPDEPFFSIQSADGKQDITAFFEEDSFKGETYPWRKQDKSPVLPIVMYHASHTGQMWDPWFGIELVEGALTCAVFWTFFGHVLRDASWPQRWATNAIPAGQTANGNGDSHVVTDPSSVLLLMAANPEQPINLGQWEPGGDPEVLGRAIRGYASDLAVDFGISPGDLERQMGDARSGFAIFLTREGVRATQRRVEPQFRRNDVLMMTTAAAMWNSITKGPTLLESGWDIEYRGLPLSIIEKQAKMDAFEKKADLGITSKVELVSQLEGVSMARARELLKERRKDMSEFP